MVRIADPNAGANYCTLIFQARTNVTLSKLTFRAFFNFFQEKNTF